MKATKLTRLFFVLLVLSCQPKVEPAFETTQYYGRQLLSPEECAKRQFRDEFTCHESVGFRPDGKAIVFLGGSDAGSGYDYQRKGKKIILKSEYNRNQTLTFQVLSETEIKWVDTGDVWIKQ
jgi:hypothetical protein